MVFNATFNNITAISWQSVLLVEETGVTGENHRPAASHLQNLSHNMISSTPRLSGIRTRNVSDCIGSCKSNCHISRWPSLVLYSELLFIYESIRVLYTLFEIFRVYFSVPSSENKYYSNYVTQETEIYSPSKNDTINGLKKKYPDRDTLRKSKISYQK